MISEYKKYHGTVFTELTEKSTTPIQIESLKGNYENSAYVVNNKVGVYIKYSTSRLSPWKFSFQKKHQDTILELRNILDRVMLILICGDDGIVGLSWESLKQVLNDEHEAIEWIRVSRPKGANYRVFGSDGKLNSTITRHHFSDYILDFKS